MVEILKGPANIQLAIIIGVGFILIFLAGFMAAHKVFAIANRTVFESVSTHQCLDGWANKSKSLEELIDRRFQHKSANEEQARIYRDKELRDLIVGLSDRISGLGTGMHEGFRTLNEKVDPLNDAKIRHDVEILALRDQINDMKNGKHVA